MFDIVFSTGPCPLLSNWEGRLTATGFQAGKNRVIFEGAKLHSDPLKAYGILRINADWGVAMLPHSRIVDIMALN